MRRMFAFRKVLDLNEYKSVLKSRNRKFNMGILASGIATMGFFSLEWYIVSTFAPMVGLSLLYLKKTDVLLNKLVLTLEIDENDTSLARFRTLKESVNLNIPSVVALTDIYPAYTALRDTTLQLEAAEDQKIAVFDGDIQSKQNRIKEILKLISEDAEGHIVSVQKGRVLPYEGQPDRFSFYFRHGLELYYIGFPYNKEIQFEYEELMRVLAGNRVLKPRRSVMLAEQDAKLAELEEIKIRARLRGEPVPELPNTPKGELPLSQSQVSNSNSVN